jgi:hypothetical protein
MGTLFIVVGAIFILFALVKFFNNYAVAASDNETRIAANDEQISGHKLREGRNNAETRHTETWRQVQEDKLIVEQRKLAAEKVEADEAFNNRMSVPTYQNTILIDAQARAQNALEDARHQRNLEEYRQKNEFGYQLAWQQRKDEVAFADKRPLSFEKKQAKQLKELKTENELLRERVELLERTLKLLPKKLRGE